MHPTVLVKSAISRGLDLGGLLYAFIDYRAVIGGIDAWYSLFPVRQITGGFN